MVQTPMIKIELGNFSEALHFEALQYKTAADGREAVWCYAQIDLESGFARVQDNDLGVLEVIPISPQRRPYLAGGRIASNIAFSLDPEAISNAEIVDRDQEGEQPIPELPEEFLAQIVDDSQPTSELLNPESDLRAGNYYLVTDSQGVTGRIYIQNLHHSGQRRLVEARFADGSHRVVTASALQWREDNSGHA